MPEPARMIPLYLARVADLRIGRMVSVTCPACGHVAEISALALREKLPRDLMVKRLGALFRCRHCGHKSAEIDARAALGHDG